MDATKPNKYKLRIGTWSQGPGSSYGMEERELFAFSAADAVLQLEMAHKGDVNYDRVVYVGPVNPDCVCLNSCRCGFAAPAGGPRKT